MPYIIFNEDCFETMKKIEKNGDKVNIILTSPPYNTGRPSTSEKARKNNENPNDYLNKVVNGFSPDKKEQWNTMMSNYGINTK